MRRNLAFLELHVHAAAIVRRERAHHAIVDEELIDALYLASQEGVRIQAMIRGICALRPGVPGLSERIEVRSILGRFLEHSRVYWFENAGEPAAWIGSADLMHRNLDRRVEVLVRLPNPDNVAEVGAVLDLVLDENTSAWILQPDGTWRKNAGQVHAQEQLIEQHRWRRMAG